MVVTAHVKIADQVWIALAILTREHPERDGFTATEVREAVGREFGGVAAGIQTHISQHCVATKRPNPGRYRMITKGSGGNRLFRPGDRDHPDRAGAKTMPDRADVPEKYHELLDWYDAEYVVQLKVLTPDSPLLHLVASKGSGKSDIAEHHDWYLNEAWDQRPTRIDR